MAETIGTVADRLFAWQLWHLHDKLSNFGNFMMAGTSVRDGGGQGVRVDTIV